MAGNERLRSSLQFRQVYVEGKRYNSHYFTVFVKKNNLNQHRLGITASRRMSSKAVERNRMKRLLREAFRLNESALNSLQLKYDWVINARRSLLTTKVTEPVNELRNVIICVLADENSSISGMNEQSL